MNKESDIVKLETWEEMLETRGSNPPQITWEPAVQQRRVQASSLVPDETVSSLAPDKPGDNGQCGL
jgi:hypothetical protein